ncbi:unnamed protein product, partial [Didymodactylos carnosus]
MLEHRAPML